MNSAQRSPIAINVFQHLSKSCKFRGIPHNAHFFRHNTRHLHRVCEKSLVSDLEESLIAAHARALAACQNESGNVGPGGILHAPMILDSERSEHRAID